MLSGQTASYQDYEVALLPFDIINISQTSYPGSYSHCCGNAIDFVGYYGGERRAYYAPFSCHRTGRTSYGYIYTSNNLVWTPNYGLTYVTVLFSHDNNPPQKTSFNQGEIIGFMGDYPTTVVTGVHCHTEGANMANAGYVDSGIKCRPTHNYNCWMLSNNKPYAGLFYITGDETIRDTKGISFTKWDGGVTPPTPPTPPAKKFIKLLLMLKRKRKGGLKRYGAVRV